MQFRITTVKSITDPVERQQRLTQLYAIFEKTPVESSATYQGEQDATGAEAEAKSMTRQGEHTTRRAAGQTGGAK